MNTLSRRITGSVLVIGGSVLVITAIRFGQFIALIYGVPLIVLGVVIFFNKKEDDIEKIKEDIKK